MALSVLLDTSFLITLVTRNRPQHTIAKQYYELLIADKIPLYFSTIVASEFAIKQPITDLPLNNFRVIPFNITHSIESARLWNLVGTSRGPGDSRDTIKDDLKIIAQASCEQIPFLLTEDASTLYKYCERLRLSNHVQTRAIKLVDGFNSAAFRPDGQQSLPL